MLAIDVYRLRGTMILDTNWSTGRAHLLTNEEIDDFVEPLKQTISTIGKSSSFHSRVDVEHMLLNAMRDKIA